MLPYFCLYLIVILKNGSYENLIKEKKWGTELFLMSKGKEPVFFEFQNSHES